MREITDANVVSSRIRLARNVEGLPFPRSGAAANPEVMLGLVRGAERAAKQLFDCDLYLMSRLSKAQKTALVERHVISLPLANNTATGAVIIEHGGGISVMLNEEDHIREQCVTDGFRLHEAYRRINRYDDLLIKTLPIAYDMKLGFLTACPTNVGTGMRASVMLFLPALKLTGRIEGVLEAYVRGMNLTVRGVYGEGSGADGDMYQLSNSRTLGVGEAEIISSVERAVTGICEEENRALGALVGTDASRLTDRISRSYAILKSAYRLSSSELTGLIHDVKLGVILGAVPISDITALDKMAQLCSASSITLKTGGLTAERRDEVRAALVKKLLSEGEL